MQLNEEQTAVERTITPVSVDKYTEENFPQQVAQGLISDDLKALGPIYSSK